MTVTASTAGTSWSTPGFFIKETAELLKKETGDCVEAAITTLQWVNKATGNEAALEAADKLEILELAFALPGVVEKIGDIKANVEKGKNLKAAQSGLLLGVKAAKSAKFFNSIDVIALKDHLKTANGIFWGCLGAFDAINIPLYVIEAGELNKQYNTAKKDEDKSIINHRFWIACLNVAKSVNCVAQACIALVSILFVSLAHGLIFNPLVFLSLTTSWLILNFGIHYYEKFVDKWADEQKKPEVKILPAGQRA